MADQLTSSTPPATRILFRQIALVALLAILFGLLIQGFILGVILIHLATPTRVALDFANGVTWSLLVCTGIAIASALSKGRAHLSAFIGVCVAPLALACAKASQKVMAGWLGAAEKQAVLSLGVLSVMRALEYGLLGWLLARLVEKDSSNPWHYLASGAVAGLLFGGGITMLTRLAAIENGSPLSTSALAATVVNEVAFPIGCALVIFIGQSVGRHLKMADDKAA